MTAMSTGVPSGNEFDFIAKSSSLLAIIDGGSIGPPSPFFGYGWRFVRRRCPLCRSEIQVFDA